MSRIEGKIRPYAIGYSEYDKRSHSMTFRRGWRAESPSRLNEVVKLVSAELGYSTITPEALQQFIGKRVRLQMTIDPETLDAHMQVKKGKTVVEVPNDTILFTKKFLGLRRGIYELGRNVYGPITI